MKWLASRWTLLAIGALALTILGGWLVYRLAGPALRELPGIVTPRPIPSVVLVEANYPDADAHSVLDLIAKPIEQHIHFLDGMASITSRSSNGGAYRLVINLEPDRDPRQCLVNVQNRVAQAMPLLPEAVKLEGVTSKVRAIHPQLLVRVFSQNGKFDQLYLNRYAGTVLRDDLARIPGVSEVVLCNEQKTCLRLWLDRQRMQARNLGVRDIFDALKDRKTRIVRPVGGRRDEFDADTILIDIERADDEAENVGNLLVKFADGARVFMRDVARVEVAHVDRGGLALFNGSSDVILAVYPAPGGSSDLGDAVRGALPRLLAKAPLGLEMEICFDFTPVRLIGPSAAGVLLLHVELPEASSAERTQRVILECERLVRGLPGVGNQLALSENPFDLYAHPWANRACVLIGVADGADRSQLAKAIRERLSKIQDARLRVCDSQQPRQQLDFAIHGRDDADVRKLAKELQARLNKDHSMSESWDADGLTVEPTVRIDIKGDEAAQFGVPMANIQDVLRFLPKSPDLDDVNRLTVRNAGGQMVPLRILAQFRQIEVPRYVERLDGQPMIRFTSRADGEVDVVAARRLCESHWHAVRKELDPRAEVKLTWQRDD